MKQIGIAVIGSGRIGTLRAEMASRHPAVRFLAVADIDLTRAQALAAGSVRTLSTPMPRSSSPIPRLMPSLSRPPNSLMWSQ
jgi:threonine dehydrogenase-like Zn-dependent dehydrogenase